MTRNEMVIVLDGGLVQSVTVPNRSLQKQLGQALIIDCDIEGADLDEIITIQLPNGTETEAITHEQPIERNTNEKTKNRY